MVNFGSRIEDRGDWTVVYLEGEIDSNTEKEFSRVFAGMQEQSKNRLVVDLGGVEHINSRGFGILVGRWQEINRSGGEMRLSGLSAHIHTLFDILGGTQIFQIFDTPEAAMSGEVSG